MLCFSSFINKYADFNEVLTYSNWFIKYSTSDSKQKNTNDRCEVHWSKAKVNQRREGVGWEEPVFRVAWVILHLPAHGYNTSRFRGHFHPCNIHTYVYICMQCRYICIHMYSNIRSKCLQSILLALKPPVQFSRGESAATRRDARLSNSTLD